MIKMIKLGRDPSLSAILSQLENDAAPQTLLWLPARSAVAESVDMLRVAAKARALGIRLGIVSRSSAVRSAARAARLPAYFFLRTALWRFERPGLRLTPSPQNRPGHQTLLESGDRATAYRRLKPTPLYRYWLGRYLTIILFFITLAILATTLFYALPSAKITLKPYIEPVSVTKTLTIDPRLGEDEGADGVIPGRLLFSVEKWQTTVDVTGVIELPGSPAHGEVVFANRLPNPVPIPAGTRVSTSGGERIVYQTTASAELPAQIGSLVVVPVIAIAPGVAGNVSAERINRIEGALAAQLNVRNIVAIGGGVNRQVHGVSEDDYARLHEHALDQLRTQALAAMRADLAPDEILVADSTRIIAIYDEIYSHFPGEETDELTLQMEAEIHATAVREADAFAIIADALAAQVRPGFYLIPDTNKSRLGEVVEVDDLGRVTYAVTSQAWVASDLPVSELLDTIRGQEAPIALTYLAGTLPLRENPSVEIWPSWFKRMPYLVVRIRSQVDVALPVAE